MRRFALPVLMMVTVCLFTGTAFSQAEGGEEPAAVDSAAAAGDSAAVASDSLAAEPPVEEPVVEDTLETVTPTEAPVLEQPGFFSKVADFFRKGGPAMWAILVFLATGLIIFVERFIFLFGIAGIKPESLMARVAELIRKGSIEGAIATTAGENAPLAKIIEAALRNYRGTERDIQNAVDEMALAELPRLNARTSYLAVLANVSTMVGLLGTIFGLIAAFAAVAAADPEQKSIMLANGISQAMNTTAFGLISAIPLLIAHSFLTAKTDRLVDDIDRYSVMVINMLAQARKEV
jgi:biopolymer transport protein ExbB/TolQ